MPVQPVVKKHGEFHSWQLQLRNHALFNDHPHTSKHPCESIFYWDLPHYSREHLMALSARAKRV